MIESFLKYLKYEKRCSKHTLASYLNDLQSFSSFLSEFDPDLLLDQVDHNLVRAWIVSLIDGGISPRSVNRKLSSLRSFYKFLVSREIVSKNPLQKLKVLKTNKPLPGFVNENEMVKMLEEADFGHDFEGWRDRLVLELFYGTGIRLSELLQLKPGDVNFYENQIKVTGKRNKQRVIPFTKSLKSIIENYESKKIETFGYNEQLPLIVTNKGEACYPMLIYRIVRKYLDLFTTLDRRSPHILRHTFATHLLNKGADLNAIKDLLGHASLAATQVYTHNSLEKLKQVFDQAHPKA
jgi:integrase/recombinase XerC